VQRLRRNAQDIRRCLEETRYHWEATTWIRMARSMGQQVNADVFEAVARSLPVELLARYRGQRETLEALLLGQAGLLTDNGSLRREYQFLRAKWGLRAVSMPVSFLRMRPANFPTVRLTQLAGLLATGTGWFARIREAGSPDEIWADAEVAGDVKPLGAAAKDKLVINAFVPLLYAYGMLRQDPGMREKALRWLHGIRAEKNTVLRRWHQLEIIARDAADGQALLELKKQYCDARRCLDCAIGNRWLNSLVNT
jgi:hypothetical protein